MTQPTEPLSASIEKTLATDRSTRLKASLRLLPIFAVVAFCFWITELADMNRMAAGIPAIGVLAMEMVPPDFSRWPHWLAPMGETLAMSIAGTAFAIVLSIPIALIAARNTTPNRFAFVVARLVLNTFRAIPELIMGIVFVAAVGFGMLPGVLALGLHSVGMVGKFFAESIEHVNPAPIEAATAAGASSMQVVAHSILPQVYPQFADVTMYRWEYNFRASMVMGMVGAGGIGTELIGALRILDYQQVSALMIVILTVVTIVDWLSSVIRRLLG